LVGPNTYRQLVYKFFINQNKIPAKQIIYNLKPICIYLDKKLEKYIKKLYFVIFFTFRPY